MYPILFEFFGIQIPTYGVVLAVSFLLGLRVALEYGRREGVLPEQVMNLWLCVLLAGVVGAKLTLYLIDLDYYIRNPSALLSSCRSAGVLYGGIVLGIVAGLVYARRAGLPIWKSLDFSAPTLAFGHALGRLGCLAAGCCYGRPTDLAWGITFTRLEAKRITDVTLDLPLHPTQILLSLGGFAVFGTLVFLYRRKSFDGQIFAVYLILETFLRFWIEFLRADRRGVLLGLPTSQTLAILGFMAGLFLLFWRRQYPLTERF